jgi:hypothetical protein
MKQPDPWGPRPADFLLSPTPGKKVLLTPNTHQARVFLHACDPDRILFYLGPALYLHPDDAAIWEEMLEELGFLVQHWTPAFRPTGEPLVEYPPAPPFEKEPDRGACRNWPYVFNEMTERQRIITHSLMELKPNTNLITIPLS